MSETTAAPAAEPTDAADAAVTAPPKSPRKRAPRKKAAAKPTVIEVAGDIVEGTVESYGPDPVSPAEPTAEQQKIEELQRQLAEAIAAAKAEPPPAEVEPVISLKELTAGLAVATILQARVKAHVDLQRQFVEEEMIRRFNGPDGTKSANIEIDGLGKVGAVTVTETADTVTVTDSKAFTDWVEEHYPTEIDYVTVVKPAFQKLLLEKNAIADHDAGIAVDPTTGEIIPGVKSVKGGTAKGIQVRIPTADKDRIAEQLSTVSLGELTGNVDTHGVVDGEVVTDPAAAA